MSAHSPRHARARGVPLGAVFVDDSGRRARWAHLALRTIAGLCLAGFALLLVSLFGGVPLPGLSDPVQLPSNEAAHPRGQQPSPNTAAATRTRSSSVPASSASAAPPASSASAPAHGATAAATAAASRTTPAPASSAPTSSGSSAPSAHSSVGRSHANTSHPTPTKTR